MKKLELLMLRDGGRLGPVDDYSWELFETIRTTKPVVVLVHQARNPLHNSKLWSLAQKVADFDPEFVDATSAVEWVKYHLKMFEKLEVKPCGTVVVRLKSICFASMDQLRFNNFYDRAVWLWSQRIGTNPELLLPERPKVILPGHGRVAA